jgi:hypothetical protein
MRAVITAMLMGIACFVHAESFDCETKRPEQSAFVAIPRFTFTIERAPRPLEPAAFRVCDAVGAAPFLLVKSSARGKSRVRRIELSEQTHEHLQALYEAALSSNFKDDVLGLDGSSWCLEAQRGNNELRACFWTPQYEAEKRGIDPFRVLGEALWQMADFGEAYGPLM